MGKVMGDGEVVELVRARSPVGAPVTMDDVRHAEALLGHGLPPLLEALYVACGNGGFGPGIRPLRNRGDDRRDAHKIASVDEASLVGHARWLAASVRLGPADDPMRWPRGLLSVCAWGGGAESAIDLTSPNARIIRIDPGCFGWQPGMGSGAVPIPAYPIGTVAPPCEFVFQLEAPSLHAWILDWASRRRRRETTKPPAPTAAPVR